MVCLKSWTAAGSGGCTGAALVAPSVVFGVCFAPLVSHMMSTIATATPRMTSCCVFFGSKPTGLAALFSTVPRNCEALCASAVCAFFSGMTRPLLSGCFDLVGVVPLEVQFLLSQHEIA